MREATLLLAVVVAGSAAVPATTEPSWAPTGRLSQFRGFATPSPVGIPENAHMMYASIWASWSAWSFCSNGVRMRVRACNTVRGFSCLGPNQETRPCDAILPPSGVEKKTNSDYDVVDPWEADRREAMKQLYPDEPEAPPQENNFVQLSPARPGPPAPRVTAPPRPRLVDHSLVGFSDRRPANGEDGSPGSDPEKLFGARQFAVNSITPDVLKETKHEELGSSELNRLVPMGSPSSSEEVDKEQSLEEPLRFEDITETATTTTLSPEPERTTVLTSTTNRVLGKQRSSGTSDRDEKISKAIGEEIAKTFSLSREHLPEEDRGKEELDASFEEAEVKGDRPVRVKPKLSPGAVDDNLEDLLEVTEPLGDQTASIPERSTTLPPVKISAETEDRDADFEPIIVPIPDAEVMDDVKIRGDNEGKEKKLIKPTIPGKKRKNFGFSGFALKKSPEEAPVQRLHDGEVTRLLFSAGLGPAPESTSTTTTTSPTTTTTSSAPDAGHSATHQIDDMPEISTDTLNALDWMLKNMSQAAAKEDRDFFGGINEASIGTREEIKASFPIGPSEPSETTTEVRPKKHKKTKRKKVKQGKKTELVKLHSGEFAPRSVDKNKMFPKFKARSMKIQRTRALGVRTVNSEMDKNQDPTKESLMADVDNPEQIFEEVKQLQAEMLQIENELKTFDSREQLPRIKALNDPLIVERADDLQIAKKEPLPLAAPGPDPLRILTPIEPVQTETKWGDWSEWGQCFCSIQLRTRICYYGTISSGCPGASHQTRLCTGEVCPAKDKVSTTTSTTPSPHAPQRTGVFEYNGGPLWPRSRLQ